MKAALIGDEMFERTFLIRDRLLGEWRAGGFEEGSGL